MIGVSSPRQGPRKLGPGPASNHGPGPARTCRRARAGPCLTRVPDGPQVCKNVPKNRLGVHLM